MRTQGKRPGDDPYFVLWIILCGGLALAFMGLFAWLVVEGALWLQRH